MIYSILRSILFSKDPEDAHHLVLDIAKLCPFLGKITGIEHNSRYKTRVGTIDWNSPVSLAAGLDKNAQALEFFNLQGFGAIECGTVTLKPQDGNPRPRIFRYPEEKSLRNAMGFPNKGLLEILNNLKLYEGSSPVGVNIGKNKETSPEESIEELSILFETLKDYAKYFAVNVSSPNTPGLRALQEKSYLNELFTELNKTRDGKDLYLKIAPDLEEKKIQELIQISKEQKLTGIIATNTTIVPELGTGGVSGELLKEKARRVQKLILKEKGNLELISVGGISNSKDIFDLWKEGGKAVQVYTAYVYKGPELIKHFAKDFDRFIDYQKLSLQDFFSLNQEERIYRLKNFKA